MSSHPHRPFPILIGTQHVYQGRVIEVRVDEIEVKDGLNVRRDGATIRFTYTTGVFVLER